MSQIDKLVYIPLLFWFVVLFIIFYFIMLAFFLPLIFKVLKVRRFAFLVFSRDPFTEEFMSLYATIPSLEKLLSDKKLMKENLPKVERIYEILKSQKQPFSKF